MKKLKEITINNINPFSVPELKPLNLTQKNVMNVILDDFRYEMNSKKNRFGIVDNLNRVFFSDGIATFVDKTSDEDVYNGSISIMIEYKGKLYNLLEFEDMYLKLNRKRKLLKLNKIWDERRCKYF